MLQTITLYDSKLNVKGLLFILTIFFLSLPGFSQKKLLEEADKNFSGKNYSAAIPLYTKLFEKNKDRTILLKIADCHYLNENYTQAQRNYAQYFKDSVYENIPQFVNYAESSKLSGKIPLAVKLYQKIYDITQNDSAKINVELYKYYLDNLEYVKVYDLDADYNCIVLDASESIDSAAAPLYYLWDFGNGETKEGTVIDHCFKTAGEHKVVLSIKDARTGLVRINDTTLNILVEKPPVWFTAPKAGRRYFYQDFDAGKLDIPGYSIVAYLWDMDNGAFVQGAKIKFRYNESADYRVKLTVIARSKYTSNIEIYSSIKKIEIKENYETPNKKFIDSLNDSK